MNLNVIVNNFEVNPLNTVSFDIAYEYGLSFPDADVLVSKLYIKSVEDLNSRFLCHMRTYDGDKSYLETDLYNVYGYVVPYDIVHGLVVSRKPLEQLKYSSGF